MKLQFPFVILLVINSIFQTAAQSNGYIVQFEREPDLEVIEKLEFHEIQLIRKIFSNPILYLANHTLNSRKLDLSELMKLPEVKYIQINRQAQLRTTEPNDPLYQDMWNLEQIHASEAWDFATSGITIDGDSIVLALFDSGYELDHPDLRDNYWKNNGEIPNDGIDNDANNYIDDYLGLNIYSGKDDHASKSHGTEVAGIISARGNNDLGISGVNWNTKLMTISKSQGSIFEADFIEAYNYAIEQRKLYNDSDGSRGAFVVAVNLSIGISRAQAADFPLWCSVYDELGRHGILGVSATDNDEYNVDIEGDMPTTCPSEFQISVSGSDRFDELMRFVAYGPVHIDLVAPGNDILTTTVNRDYTEGSGTSLATPQVTGAVGLIYMAANQELMDIVKSNPKQGARIVREIILSSTEKNISLENMVATGGRLDVGAAVRAARNYTSGPAPEFVKIVDLYPTLASDQITIEFEIPTDEAVRFEIFDMYMGRLVREFQEDSRLLIGVNLYTIPVESLGTGGYFLTIEQGKERQTRKFLKLYTHN